MDRVVRFPSHCSTPSTPIEIRNQTDPGDETSRRYRYQFGYGSILLIGSLRGDLDYKAIWCEQHEDFLGEVAEDFFDAYQIKTRKPELGEWKLSDNEVTNSIDRFVKLKREYPTSFRKFRFISNAKFNDSSAKATKHLSPIKLLAAVQHASKWNKLEDAGKKGFEYLLKRIEVDAEELFNVLKQLDFAKGPPLENFEDVLAQTHVARLPECLNYNATLLGRAVETLIQKIHQASSLVTKDPAVHYVALSNKSRKDPLLLAKRVSLDDVVLTVREVRGSFSYLPSLASLDLGTATKQLDVLQEKMIRGGLAHHYEMMRRRALSAEAVLLDLATRPDDGSQICSQVENVVLGECDDAMLRASQNPEPYGAKMLIRVQDCLKKIVDHEPTRVHHQDVDLLVGVAGLLTADCKVWWSAQFELKAAQ